MGEQQLLIGIQLGIARQNENTAIGGRQPHVDHLHRGEFLKRRTSAAELGPRGRRLDTNLRTP